MESTTTFPEHLNEMIEEEKIIKDQLKKGIDILNQINQIFAQMKKDI